MFLKPWSLWLFLYRIPIVRNIRALETFVECYLGIWNEDLFWGLWLQLLFSRHGSERWIGWCLDPLWSTFWCLSCCWFSFRPLLLSAWRTLTMVLCLSVLALVIPSLWRWEDIFFFLASILQSSLLFHKVFPLCLVLLRVSSVHPYACYTPFCLIDVASYLDELFVLNVHSAVC